jgi:hypothetical protein
MKAPRKQSINGTRQTPQAMLRPDQGTTPMRRNTESRTHAWDFGFEDLFDASGSIAERVTANAFGKKCVRKGESGAESKAAHWEPRAVRVVRRRVASAGGKRAPARTFYDGAC